MEHPIVEVYRRIYAEELLGILRRELDVYQDILKLKWFDIDVIFTRWLVNQIDVARGGDDWDPAFPSSDKDEVDVELLDYLGYKGLNVDDIKRIHGILVDQCESIRARLKSVPLSVSNRVSSRTIDDAVELRLELSRIDTRMLKKNAKFLTIRISKYYYDKLWDTIIFNINASRKRQLIFILISRYRMLGGDNYQSAIPSNTFRLLQDTLGVTHETFASPINRHIGLTFTSLYPDIDGDYGSMGSYHDIIQLMETDKPVSIQANPPFIESIMLRFTHLIHDILMSRSHPTTATIIVPSWTDGESYNMLLSSSFNRFNLNLCKDEHGYIVGSDYRRDLPNKSSQGLTSLCNTTIFVLSNTNIELDGFEDALRRSFQ